MNYSYVLKVSSKGNGKNVVHFVGYKVEELETFIEREFSKVNPWVLDLFRGKVEVVLRIFRDRHIQLQRIPLVPKLSFLVTLDDFQSLRLTFDEMEKLQCSNPLFLKRLENGQVAIRNVVVHADLKAVPKLPKPFRQCPRITTGDKVLHWGTNRSKDRRLFCDCEETYSFFDLELSS